uniref:Uncharacterized protein n=1 Tax=Oryza nivara TaxID=4536 RepID=A0A0E0FUA2_ORYNI
MRRGEGRSSQRRRCSLPNHHLAASLLWRCRAREDPEPPLPMGSRRRVVAPSLSRGSAAPPLRRGSTAPPEAVYPPDLERSGAAAAPRRGGKGAPVEVRESADGGEEAVPLRHTVGRGETRGGWEARWPVVGGEGRS